MAGRWLVALPSRFEFSATRQDLYLVSTAPYLNPVKLALLPLSFFLYFLYLLFPLVLFSSLLRPHSETHALILNPLDILPPLPIPTTSLHISPLMSTKGRSTPRVVCCAIPIARAAGKVLVITSRKRPNYWVCQCLPPDRSTSALSLIQPPF